LLPQDDQLEFQGGTETVLLVEDEAAVRKLTIEVLERQGYRVLSAINGRDATRVFENSDNEDIDLLLTDVVMPLMGGRELAKIYKSRYPEGKVIYMSGYPSATQPDADFLRSQADFMQKPITLSDLTRKIRETLDVD
jgi:DNA-binding NtrC family response regulator